MRQPLQRPALGFVAVPNEYFNGWMKEVEPAEAMILNFILRKTLGYQKPEDWISLTQFESIGLSRHTIIKAIKGLETKEMIYRRKEGEPGKEKYFYRLNIEPLDKKDGIICTGAEIAPVQFLTTTSAEIAPTKDNITINKEHIMSHVFVELACRLKARILANNPGAKITESQMDKWANVARLMMQTGEGKDNRTEGQIIEVIEWATHNDFWIPNILSMGKLREKFDTLTMQMHRQKSKPNLLNRERSLNYVVTKQPSNV